jgi:hypothetical protein
MSSILPDTPHAPGNHEHHEGHEDPMVYLYTVDGVRQVSDVPDLTVRDILIPAEIDPADHYLVEVKEPEPIEYRNPNHVIHLREDEHETFVTVLHIVYTVDGERQVSDVPDLTVRQILVKAGVDPADHYLVEIKEPKPVEFRNLDEVLHLREHETFVTVFHGPTPVS